MEQSFYETIKDNKHIFIYGVCGRSATTALQRILNSSGEVTIFGESWEVSDGLLGLIHTLSEKQDERWVAIKNRGMLLLQESIKENRHDKFYANAYRPLDNTIFLLIEAFCEQYRPLIDVSRIGFKEISVASIEVLQILQFLFSESVIIFLFRDPLEQFVSIRSTEWFDYSHDLDMFLNQYKKFSRIYMDFAKDNKNAVLIENTDLEDIKQVKKLVEWTGLSGLDEELVGNILHSSRDYELDPSEEKTILESAAYRNYLKMKKQSKIF